MLNGLQHTPHVNFIASAVDSMGFVAVGVGVVVVFAVGVFFNTTGLGGGGLIKF